MLRCVFAYFVLLLALGTYGQTGQSHATGDADIEQPYLRGLRIISNSSTAIRLAWDSSLPTQDVKYRISGEQSWYSISPLREPYTTVIGLKPGTDYDFCVCGTQPSSNSPMMTDVVTTRTAQAAEKIEAGLRVRDPWRVELGGDGNIWLPCIDVYKGSMWMLFTRGGNLTLVQLNDQLNAPMRSVVIVPASLKMHITAADIVVKDGRLYVTWTRDFPGTTALSCVHLRTYDFESGQMSEIMRMPVSREDAHCLNGGMCIWKNELWAASLESWGDSASSHSQILVRPFKDGNWGTPIVYADCPEKAAMSPWIGACGDQLALTFTVRTAPTDLSSPEPMYLTFFNGKIFSPARTIAIVGRNRMGRSVTLGDKLICPFQSTAPHLEEFGGKYQEILVAAVDLKTGACEVSPITDDLTYNMSTDICVSGERAYAVWSKFERAMEPGQSRQLHGAWMTELSLAK